jgi:hypothetical protein
VVVGIVKVKRLLAFFYSFFRRSIEMFIKTQFIFLALISVVFSQTDDEESFLFVTKQTVNRFIVQDKELTIKYGLYNSGPT